MEDTRTAIVTDGLVVVVKRYLRDLPPRGARPPGSWPWSEPLTVYSQDDASFPDGFEGVVDDTDLELS